MREYVEIGPAPYAEDCVQVSQTEAYMQPMKEECARYVECIREHCGRERGGASLRIKSNPHDFGTYYDVVCYYDDDDDVGAAYAYHIESHAPELWDGTGAKRFEMQQTEESRQ